MKSAMQIKLLLLIEDNPVYEEYLRTLLMEDVEGIKHASTLEEARVLMLLFTFSVIALDLGLPDSPDRMHTVQQIPKIKELQPDAAILVMSAYPEYKEAALEAGANLFLDKAETAKKLAMITAVKVAMQDRHSNPKKNTQRLQRLVKL